MFAVTGGAVHGAVEALELIELDLLWLMAGQARRGKIFGQAEFKGGMRIGMALQASFKLVMALSAVALAALRYYLHDVGRMSRMAVHAGHAGFMGAAFFCDILRRLGMTFDAVTLCQRRFLALGRHCLSIFIGTLCRCRKSCCQKTTQA